MTVLQMIGRIADEAEGFYAKWGQEARFAGLSPVDCQKLVPYLAKPRITSRVGEFIEIEMCPWQRDGQCTLVAERETLDAIEAACLSGETYEGS